MMGAPKGKPTQVDKIVSALSPNSITNSTTLATLLSRINYFFQGLSGLEIASDSING